MIFYLYQQVQDVKCYSVKYSNLFEVLLYIYIYQRKKKIAQRKGGVAIEGAK